MTEEPTLSLVELTAEITANYVGNNHVASSEVAGLIQAIHDALAGLGAANEEPQIEAHKPAVSIRSSVKPDHIMCLEDGKKLTMLKRYLRTQFGMSPDEYRAKWGLPSDYPMVAPSYADRRRTLAKEIGLGRKPKTKA